MATNPPNQCIPFWEPGTDLTVFATTAVTGKKFVKISGNLQSDGVISVAPPTAAGRVFGVAQHDIAVNKRGGVLRGRHRIVPVTSAADIAAAQEVEVDGTGAVVPLAAGVAVGVAVTGSTSGNDAMISLY